MKPRSAIPEAVVQRSHLVDEWTSEGRVTTEFSVTAKAPNSNAETVPAVGATVTSGSVLFRSATGIVMAIECASPPADVRPSGVSPFIGCVQVFASGRNHAIAASERSANRLGPTTQAAVAALLTEAGATPSVTDEDLEALREKADFALRRAVLARDRAATGTDQFEYDTAQLDVAEKTADVKRLKDEHGVSVRVADWVSVPAPTAVILEATSNAAGAGAPSVVLAWGERRVRAVFLASAVTGSQREWTASINGQPAACTEVSIGAPRFDDQRSATVVDVLLRLSAESGAPPGSPAEVRLVSADSKGMVLSVPASSVLVDGNGAFVELVTAGPPDRRAVTTGPTIRGRTVLLDPSDVGEGDQIRIP